MDNLKLLIRTKLTIWVMLMLCHPVRLNAQIIVFPNDTMHNANLSLSKKTGQLKITGYIQTQFQIAEKSGITSYAGGNFPDDVSNRFSIRRGRIKFDYLHFSKIGVPEVQFVFQVDGTERGVFIRDVFAKVMENKFSLFAFTFGMFPRPFGYEVNLSSSERESPERGRMSQILMRTERDLGAMISLDSRRNNFLKKIKLDAGFFNGPGLAATSDIDSHKDFISRISLKSQQLSKRITFSSGISLFKGSMIQNTPYVFTVSPADLKYRIDSSASNKGKYAPRNYYGADLQIKRKFTKGFSELRLEYITGKQTGTINSSETPGQKLSGTEGYFIRNFNGMYIYFLQNIFNEHHQFIIKYDWYDPDTNVKKNELNPSLGFTKADIKFSTLGAGYCYYLNSNLKTTIWYDRIWNEHTALPGLQSDLKDDVLTFRMQLMF